jgi:hypothetical protein
MPQALNERLLRVSKASSKEATIWREGIDIASRTGRSLDDLARQAAQDRWMLAHDFRIRASAFSRGTPKRPRDAISRYYYAMYHAMRAAAYMHYGGDEHQEHKNLPSKTPADFPSREFGENRLKDVRELRNRADYDPYPKSSVAWTRLAMGLASDCDRLLSETKSYLVAQGCVLS